MMSVAEDLERRLENWARWCSGGSSGPGCVSSIYGFAADDYLASRLLEDRQLLAARIPIINGEAIDCDAAIRKLDGPHDPDPDAARPLEDALRARYLRVAKNGLTKELYTMHTLSEIQVAAALYMSYATYLRRLNQAKRALQDQLWFASGRKIQA